MRHHNPFSKGDRESLILGMEVAELKFSNKVFRVQQSIAEDELVAVHSKLVLDPGKLDLVTVHFFRFEAGKIIEFWDVAMGVPDDSPDENTMF